MKKMRRLLSVLIIGILALVALSGMSAAFGMGLLGSEGEVDPLSEIPKPVVVSGDYEYQENGDGTVTIAQYDGTDMDIVIPEEIDGYPVTAIGYQAFTYLDMNSLTIPETVEVIEPRAFEYCTITDGFVLPENVTVMGDAFAYAELPQVVTIPSGAIVEEDAFAYNKVVQILCVDPDASIGEGAFGYSYDLSAVVCAEGSSLGDDAFEYSDYLEQVVLCGDVKVDGDPVSYCDHAKISHVAAEDYATVMEVLQGTAGGSGTDDTTETLKPQGWFSH